MTWPAYKTICAELGVSPSSDFRFTSGQNHGLGSICIYVSNFGPSKISYSYPGGHYYFFDEGGLSSKGNLIYYFEPDDSAQADCF